MKKQGADLFCAYGRSVLRPLLKRFLEQIEGVRNSRDPEYIHDMRVASRRLRAALPVFSACFQKKSYRRVQKQVRRITRALGLARDRDVQILFLQNIMSRTSDPAVLPGLEYLLRVLWFERNLLQQPVQEELNRLDERMILEGVGDLSEKSSSPPTERPFTQDIALLSRAAEDIHQRIDELLRYEPSLRDPSAITEHHAMRIAAKRLRYTMEVYSSLVEGDLFPAIKKVRNLQDALGELHDTDVWIAMLPRFLEKEQALFERSLDRSHLMDLIEPGMLYLQDECRGLRLEQFTLASECWDEIRDQEILEGARGLIQARVEAAGTAGNSRKGRRSARLRAITRVAEQFSYEEGHARQVTALALGLFDALKPLHRMGGTQKEWLQCAGILHDIGYTGGVKGHHKRGHTLILKDPGLPFSGPERDIIASVVRYHGTDLPAPGHRPFGQLPPRDQQRVSMLAAILRIADALDVSHEGHISRVEPELQQEKVIFHYTSVSPAPAEESSFLRKKNLFETVFERSAEIFWSSTA